jgi:hypothetical protein
MYIDQCNSNGSTGIWKLRDVGKDAENVGTPRYNEDENMVHVLQKYNETQKHKQQWL